MAGNLRAKFSYDGPSSNRRPRSITTASQSTSGTTPAMPKMDPAATNAMKADIIASLKADIADVIRGELKHALTENFNILKSELRDVKSEIANNTAAFRSEMDALRGTITGVEGGLSTCSDDITGLQATVTELKAELANLTGKCEDMEGRMRRCNVRIVGVAEDPDSSSTAAVSKLLKEVLHIENDILVDRSHRGLAPRRADGKPRVIVAKLHYYQDCVDVLRRVRESGPLHYKGNRIAIFPDYTASVAKARSAFNDIRNLLRGRRDVRYGVLFPARLRISYKGDDKEFLDPVKAMAYVKTIVTTDGSG